MDNAYRIITTLIAPLIPLWLFIRVLQGKEDIRRLRERYGFASRLRPQGRLIWLHAASIGEANSLLLLIDMLRKRFPSLPLLLTTGTVTSAMLMHVRLPKGVIHQYVPIDTPQATRRFISYWKPSMAFFVESELWPNLIEEAQALECFMGLINARMSERSFVSWQKYPHIIARMLERFDIVCAQSSADGERLQALGARHVQYLGNLKYDAPPLLCNEAELLTLKTTLAGRKLWLAASTHPGEEKTVALAHELLAARFPGLLTVIVPRHPERGTDIARTIKKYGTIALRSQKQAIAPTVDFYIADTIGELGLFYRLCEIAFIGGSLVAHGGQNPLEPARLSCGIIAGMHTHNFSDMYDDMERVGACLRTNNASTLAMQVALLLSDSDILYGMQKTAKQWVESNSGTANRIFTLFEPVIQLIA